MLGELILGFEHDKGEYITQTIMNVKEQLLRCGF